MVLAAVESSPVLLLRFAPEAKRPTILAVVQALTEGGIVVVDSEGLNDADGDAVLGPSRGAKDGRPSARPAPKGARGEEKDVRPATDEKKKKGNGKKDRDRDCGCGAVVLGLTTTQKLLEHEAQIARLVKPRRTPHGHIPSVMDPFCDGRARVDFVGAAPRSVRGSARGGEGEDDSDEHDRYGLFTSAERAMLVERLVRAVKCPRSLEFDPADRRGTFVKAGAKSLAGAAFQKLTSEVQKLRVSLTSRNGLDSDDDEEDEDETSMMQVLFEKELVDEMSPVQVPHIKKRILRETYSIWTPPPIQSIRDYYGEEVAFYFAWMHHMTLWFLFPGAVGLLVWIARRYRGDTVDSCDLTPFMGPVTFFWALFCIRFWERREAELAYKWGTFTMTHGDELSLGLRLGFHGKMRLSPITGKYEKYYPCSKRRLKCAVSAAVTLIILSGACVVMVISMNVQGYVSRADKELWGDRDHPLYFPFFSQLAEKGNIFDCNCWWRSLLPVILRAIVVANMNQQYSRLAEWLTDWENHETIQGHQDSLVLKRVLFEAFDAYVVMIYLAIYERDVVLLRQELVGAFNVDTLRRVVTECILPYLMIYKDSFVQFGYKKDDDCPNSQPSQPSLAEQAKLEEYDTFDDYIKMLIQFGYVTLFASAYPLAAFIAVIANWIEIRTGICLVCFLFKTLSNCIPPTYCIWFVFFKNSPYLQYQHKRTQRPMEVDLYIQTQYANESKRYWNVEDCLKNDSISLCFFQPVDCELT
ncbi:hypothetical protein ACHAWF_007603 [Thalassiosira exigua]